MTTARLAHAALALALPLALALMAGCSEDEPDGSRAAGASDTASADATVDHPEEGLDLVDRPEPEGVYQRALQTYVDFERGRRQAAREGRLTNLLSFNATAPVVDPYRRALRAYAGRGTYDGVVAVEFLDLRPRDQVLTIDVCVDATRLVVPDGAPTLLGEATRARQQVKVSNIVGEWRVTRVEQLDGSC